MALNAPASFLPNKEPMYEYFVSSLIRRIIEVLILFDGFVLLKLRNLKLIPKGIAIA